MSKKKRGSRIFSSGGGFVIACLFGLFGIATGAVLFMSGFSIYVLCLVYIAVPAAMILALYIAYRM